MRRPNLAPRALSGRSAWALAAGLLVAGCALAGNPARAEEKIDHLTLLEQMSSEVAGEILDEMQFPPGTTVHLVPESPHPANWLVARILERTLVARGYRVVAAVLAVGPGSGEAAAKPSRAAPAAEGDSGESGADGESLFGTDEEDESSESGDDEGAQDDEDDLDDEDDDSDGQESSGADQDDSEGQEEGTAGDGVADEDARESADAPGRMGPRARRQEAEQQVEAAQPAAESAGFEVNLPGEGHALVFRVVDCGVSYPWAKRSWLIGPRRYGRMASVRVWASWIGQPGRQVQSVASAERVHLDAFPGWARPMLEGHAYPFPIEQPTTASLRQVIEPVVVAGIISGLIYLFYQNQK